MMPLAPLTLFVALLLPSGSSAQESPYEDAGTLDHPGEEVTCLAFSPDGKILATGSRLGVFRFWDLETKQAVRQQKAHPWAVGCIAYSPDGRRLVTGSEDRTAKIWEVESCRERYTLSGHKNWVTAVAFSPDGKTVATGGLDSQLKLWNADTGELIRTHKPGRKVSALAFRPSGRILLCGLRDKDFNIQIWDLQTGKEIDPLKAESDPVLAGLKPEELQRRIQEIEQGKKEAIERIKKTEGDPKKQEEEIARIKQEAKDTKEALFGEERNMRSLRWELYVMLYNTGKKEQGGGGGFRLPDEEVLGMSFFDGGKRLATAGIGKVMMWDLESADADRSLGSVRPGGGVNCFAATSDGLWLACGGTDFPKNPYFVRILDGAKGKVLDTLLVHDNSVLAAIPGG